MKRLLTVCLVGLLVAIIPLASGVAPATAQVLYSLSSDTFDNNLRRLDPADGSTIAAVPISVPGRTILTANGLATHPQTGQLFALLTFDDTPSQPERFLVTIDPQSATATIIGNTHKAFAGLAFAADGTLYGVTGDGGKNPGTQDAETLFTISTTTGEANFFLTLGHGNDGEAIAYNPGDGFLYHASGFGEPNLNRIFEKINLATKAISGVPLSGFDSNEITALTYAQGVFLAADLDNNFMTMTPNGAVTLLGSLDHRAKGLAFATAPPQTTLVASVLPSSRSVEVNTPATAFATIINAGPNPAFQVGVSLATAIPGFLTYNATDCLTNAVIGGDNAPVNIGVGLSACFVIAIAPFASFSPTEVAFSFAGINTAPVDTLAGINTLLMSASDTPVPDIVALAATINSDGIVNIPATEPKTGVFAVATVNVGASGSITVSANTGGASLPVGLLLCPTNPITGQCLGPQAPSVTMQFTPGATPTFGIFVTGNGTVPFDPALNRVFVQFADGGGVVRGRTSVAARTQAGGPF